MSAEAIAARFTTKPSEPDRLIEIRNLLENNTNAGGHYRALSKMEAEYMANVALDSVEYLLRIIDGLEGDR